MVAENAAGNATEYGAAPPPAQQQSADEVIDMLNRTPLFMTELDESDADGGQNADLEALRALAYEGTKAEVAENFKNQGNDCVKTKQWSDAREFYSKALAVLKGQEQTFEQNTKTQAEWFGEDDRKVVDLDEEAVKEKQIEEACYTNRALCNLELKNYGSCNRDCAAALSINNRNVKAYYRSGMACLALEKLDAAADACKRAQAIDPGNAAVKTLVTKIGTRAAAKQKVERERQERMQRQNDEARTLMQAVKDRNIAIKRTKEAPADVEDAKMALENPLDASSTLSIPTLLLYPTAAQTDLIKAFGEDESLIQHLEYIFPCPWDKEGEFTLQSVECYMDTVSGGLIKVGKKVSMASVLSGGKAEVKDGIVRIYVLPKAKVNDWIAEFKRRKGG